MDFYSLTFYATDNGPSVIVGAFQPVVSFLKSPEQHEESNQRFTYWHFSFSIQCISNVRFRF